MAEKVNKIAEDDIIKPIKDKTITVLDPYLSLAIPPIKAPASVAIKPNILLTFAISILLNPISI